MMTCLSKKSLVGNSVYRESKFNHASLPDGIVIYRDGVSETQFQDDCERRLLANTMRDRPRPWKEGKA